MNKPLKRFIRAAVKSLKRLSAWAAHFHRAEATVLTRNALRFPVLHLRLLLSRIKYFYVLLSLAASAFNVSAAENIGPLELLPQALVTSRGIFLGDLVTNTADAAVPPILLGQAPAVGRPVYVSRFQLNDLLAKKAPELVCTGWFGADRVKIVRAARVINEVALKELLAGALQTEQVKDRGELEIHFSRPWRNLVVPDDPVSLRIVELPTIGVTSSFICRFELLSGETSLGTYQQPLQARVWKEIYVARSAIPRGQLLRDADLALERRDILNNHDYLASVPVDDPYVEFRDSVPVGTQVTSRALHLRSIIKRGRQVDAMFQDDALTIAVKAEALEDGVPGQIVRVRNLQSRREFKGKVQDEQTVLVIF